MLGVFVTVNAFSVFAQDRKPLDREAVERTIVLQGPEGPAPPGADKMVFERHMQGPEAPLPPGGPGDFVFLATEMSFGGKLVKGAPYSAQSVTESIQTLPDGNRIINKSTAAIYRDSEGRTRREQSFKAIGPFPNAGDLHQTIFISDPVAGTSYTLDPNSRIARKMPPLRFKLESKQAPAEGPTGTRVEEPPQYRIEIAPDAMIQRKADSNVVIQRKATEAGVRMGWVAARNENARTESLGKQNIEGVDADGTRTTITIPAGEIGNERAIEIVSERWYSPQLQTIVMTRHTDPRFGENSYRLTNITREEPARSLFEIPGDYTIKEGPPSPEPMKLRRAAPPEQP
jgi:hypothetical protein